MIFVDTGAWYALAVRTDPDHEGALDYFTSVREPLVTTDYVVDETLTLLRSRGQNQRALAIGARLFRDELAEVQFLTRADILAAWQVFERYSDKGWSFTDCTSKVVMERMGITRAFAFDDHFRQFGSVIVQP